MKGLAVWCVFSFAFGVLFALGSVWCLLPSFLLIIWGSWLCGYWYRPIEERAKKAVKKERNNE